MTLSLPAVSDDVRCLTCGACCAAFRVSFYWAEADAHQLPRELSEKLTPFRACMVGTNRSDPRCAALEGQIGQAVRCTVYSQRPTPCREYQVGDERCNEARASHGLPPLTPGCSGEEGYTPLPEAA